MTADIEVRGLKVHAEGSPDEILNLLRSLGGEAKAEKEYVPLPYPINPFTYPWGIPDGTVIYGGTYTPLTWSSAWGPVHPWPAGQDHQGDDEGESLVSA